MARVGDTADATLGIGAVSRRTGLSPDVIRVWERRHQAIEPLRTLGGTRVYSEPQIRRLELLATLVAKGHRIGQLASLSDTELGGVLAEREQSASPTGERSVSPAGEPSDAGDADWLETAMRSVMAVDSGRLEQQLSALYLSLGVRCFTLEVALPLLVRVGDLWEAGELSVAAEHACTSVLRTLLGGALRRRGPGADAQRVVFATPFGQRHEFGALSAALLGSEQGLDAIYLGADLPAEAIAFAVEQTEASAVVLGLHPRHLPGNEDPHQRAAEIAYLQTLRESLPDEVVVCVGGRTDGLPARELGITVFESLLAFDELVGRFGRLPSRPWLDSRGSGPGPRAVD